LEGAHVSHSGSADNPVAYRHWPGTETASAVPTPSFESGFDAAGEAISEAGLLALLGSPGLGKTFLIKSVAEKLSVPLTYLECPPLGRSRLQIIELLRALSSPCNASEDAATLLHVLADACSSSRVIALDEVDRWGREGVELIRYLWSQSTNRTAFIFAGSRVDRLVAANPALDSRLEHRVKFEPLSLEEARVALRAYHPLFAVNDERVLERIHRLTHGEFRLIAQLLRRCLVESEGESVAVSDELLDRAWSSTGRLATRRL
jgi:Cdc6-like AAA superfamily ATPase